MVLSVLVLVVGFIGLLLAVQPSTATESDGDEVLLVEPNGMWHIRTSGVADYTFWYGVPGDVPLLGDWDGDGFDTPGMYRASNGFAYLTNDLPPPRGVGSGDPALTFFFGIPGDQVFVGDWNGDGIDTLGISRNGHMYLSNTNATVFADIDFSFGEPTDLAYGGDPDGDGIDNVFLYRRSTGNIYYRTTNTSGGADGNAYFGEPADQFVIGDWDNDGNDTVGVFQTSDRTISLWNTLTGGSADITYYWGQSSWMPVAGHIA